MATVQPFRALRYSPSLAPDLARVTAPPYDVIDASLQEALLAEDYNIAQLDCNSGTTDLNDPGNRYRQAAHRLGVWRDAGVLRRDSSPGFYVYEQTYDWSGAEFRRRSFIARVRLEPLGSTIHPHERTFSGPKQDRFNLTVETRCNLSQVLGIYPDDDGAVIGCFDQTVRRAPDAEAVGRDGVRNRLWVETDPQVLAQVSARMKDKHITIADGHHRYETALRYEQWLEEMEALPPDHAARYTTFALVGSGDPGLRVMPTHRVLSGLRGFDLRLFKRQVVQTCEWQDVEVNPTDGDALEAWIAEQPLNSVGVLTPAGVARLVPRSERTLEQALPDASPALRGLNVSVLHQAVLPVGIEQVFGQGDIKYVHLASEAVQLLQQGADVAFLLRATPLQSVLDIAEQHEVMPQKSTYFYPKLLTGLVLYPLRD